MGRAGGKTAGSTRALSPAASRPGHDWRAQPSRCLHRAPTLFDASDPYLNIEGRSSTRGTRAARNVGTTMDHCGSTTMLRPHAAEERLWDQLLPHPEARQHAASMPRSSSLELGRMGLREGPFLPNHKGPDNVQEDIPLDRERNIVAIEPRPQTKPPRGPSRRTPIFKRTRRPHEPPMDGRRAKGIAGPKSQGRVHFAYGVVSATRPRPDRQVRKPAPLAWILELDSYRGGVDSYPAWTPKLRGPRPWSGCLPSRGLHSWQSRAPSPGTQAYGTGHPELQPRGRRDPTPDIQVWWLGTLGSWSRNRSYADGIRSFVFHQGRNHRVTRGSRSQGSEPWRTDTSSHQVPSRSLPEVGDRSSDTGHRSLVIGYRSLPIEARWLTRLNLGDSSPLPTSPTLSEAFRRMQMTLEPALSSTERTDSCEAAVRQRRHFPCSNASPGL